MKEKIKYLEESLSNIIKLIEKGRTDTSIDLDDLHREKKYCEITIKKLKKNES